MSQTASWLVLIVAGVCWAAGVARAEHFDSAPTRAQLQERFAELRAAKTLRVDTRLRWEYRFSSPDVLALEALSLLLVADDYKIATLLPPHEGAPAATLRVVRVEQHTPDSLEQRSAELRRRATVQGATYDGVDVGRRD